MNTPFDIDALVTSITDSLMTSVIPVKKAKRLQLRGPNEEDLGGYCRKAVESNIRSCLQDAEFPTGTEARVCTDIAERQSFGMNKYGVSVANNPLSLRQWLQHAYEECLDQAVYLKRAMEEMEKK